METSKKVKCPECGELISLSPVPGNPARVQAFCGCSGRGLYPVLETDDVNYNAAVLEPAERVPPAKKRSK